MLATFYCHCLVITRSRSNKEAAGEKTRDFPRLGDIFGARSVAQDIRK